MNISHGYAISLATRPRMSTAIPYTWRPGKMNFADYWTKHHPAPHHQNMRREFLTPHIILEMLRIEKQTYAARAA
jgi:hypothetical protein